MARRKKIEDNSVSEEAKKAAEKIGWGYITPKQACKMIGEMRAKGLAAKQIADHLNKVQVVRGSYRDGNPKWNKDHVKYVYLQYHGKTLSGRKRRNKKITKVKRQPAQQTAFKPVQQTVKATRNALKFVQQNPEYTIWSDLAVVRLLEQKRAAGLLTIDVMRQLNKDKILRSNYISGTPEWDGTNLSKLYRKIRGRTVTGHNQAKQKKCAKQPERAAPVLSNGFSLKDIPRENIKDVQLVDGGYARATIEVLVPRDDPKVLEITNQAIQAWLQRR